MLLEVAKAQTNRVYSTLSGKHKTYFDLGEIGGIIKFEDIVEIARASRLRVRRSLLRANWWKRDVGPLVAWHGDERKRHRNLARPIDRVHVSAVRRTEGKGRTQRLAEIVACSVNLAEARGHRAKGEAQ